MAGASLTKRHGEDGDVGLGRLRDPRPFSPVQKLRVGSPKTFRDPAPPFSRIQMVFHLDRIQVTVQCLSLSGTMDP